VKPLPSHPPRRQGLATQERGRDTNPLADACRNPFSNGTERYAWEGVWCTHCVHDHDVTHEDNGGDGGCPILLEYDAYCGTDAWRWPEAWLPEPDDGKFCLPSRMVCGQFEPCHRGECDGDPTPDIRAAIVSEVTVYWSGRS
jgi:hypothetical protein